MSKSKPKEPKQEITIIDKWIDQAINGGGGFLSYEEHEFVIFHVPREQAVAEWVIRCLANPDCEGSKEVLDSILEQRENKSENG